MRPQVLTRAEVSDSEPPSGPELVSHRLTGRVGGEDSHLIEEFTEKWDLGESPRIEDYLDRIDPPSHEQAVDLIYRQYCLEEADGASPSSAEYLDRFATYREQLDRLFQLHGAFTASQLQHWARREEIVAADDGFDLKQDLPGPGDQIGHYFLRRILGEGAYARVFLAEQLDLNRRHIVIKVSTRPSHEPWLLVKAKHPHIVDVITQCEVDDGLLQLISMPFRGGTTLSTLLDTVRQSSRRPTTGQALLNLLDSVSAPEFPKNQRSGTTRGILADLSCDRAMAWMVARLAEALDHAATRNVAHGDIKPSNILITADADPMLLDFNLAQEWSEDEEDGGAIERGGTLAYMAPERLRIPPTNGDVSPSSPLHSIAPQSSDLYSLGMVFLEMLSGNPTVPPDECGSQKRGRGKAKRNFRERATELAEWRTHTDPLNLIEGSGGHRIPAALRSILARCLDPDPERRYRRGRDLATDLDRWRQDLPLVFAHEDRINATGRRIRRSRRPILIVASVLLASGLAGFGTNKILSLQYVSTWLQKGQEMVASLWDAKEIRAFVLLRSQLANWLDVSVRPMQMATISQNSLEIASLALEIFKVLDPSDWREREEVRYLPEPDREDLELWLLEQAYRYFHDIACRPDSPSDWERALAGINKLQTKAPVRPFAELAIRLEQAITEFDSSRRSRSGMSPVTRQGTSEPPLGRPWLEEYLMGVALECEAEANPSLPLGVTRAEIGSLNERILSHYQAALGHRPNLFWANYRAAVICWRLGLGYDRISHLNACASRRPGNAAIHGLLSSALYSQNRLAEALEESNRAIEIDPDHPEYYRTRGFVSANLGRYEDVRGDLHHFEVLSRMISVDLLRTRFRLKPPRQSSEADLRLAMDRPRKELAEIHPRNHAADRHPLTQPDEIDTRFNLAQVILAKTGDREQVLSEVDKILVLDPSYLHARILRAGLLAESRRFEESRREVRGFLHRSDLSDFVVEHPDVIARLLDISWVFMGQGINEDALELAANCLSIAESSRKYIGRANYVMARALARTGRKDQAQIERIAQHLASAYRESEGRVRKELSRFREWYAKDASFNPIRAEVDQAFAHLERTHAGSSNVQASINLEATRIPSH